MRLWIAALLTLAISPIAAAPTVEVPVEMTDRGASTFYVDVYMLGAGLRPFLVDTGSSYSAINENTLAELLDSDQARYVKDLEGVLADGSRQTVPIYMIRSLTVGKTCRLRRVQAAVFPGQTRNILGLSALRTAAPFVFSVDPPTLTLRNCQSAVITPGTTLRNSGAED